MIELPQIPTATVPCNGCYECCKRQATTVAEDFGDDMQFFIAHTDPIPGQSSVRHLRHKPNGDCVFLDRATGCTIYDKRPAMCRFYDCVAQRDSLKELGYSDKFLPGPIRKAARRLSSQGYRPTTTRVRREAIRMGIIGDARPLR